MTDPWSTFLSDPAKVPHQVLAETLLSVLELKPSMHGDHAPDPDWCRFCDGEAYGLEKVKDRIRNMITHSAEPSINSEGEHHR